MIFNSNTLHQLKRLQLIARQVKAGTIRGERRSTRQGKSTEFADYRDYVPGDDLRQLDWNIYARHDRPFIKLMEDEQDLAVYIVVDGSKSMDWGESDENKFTYARRLAAGFGVIGLFTGDQVWVDVFGTKTKLGPIRGDKNLLRLLEALEVSRSTGEIDLYKESLQFNASRKKPGLLILISDLLFPAGYQEGLKRLQGDGHEIILLHTLSQEELVPSLNGEFRLIDCETGSPQEVKIDRSMQKLYIDRISAWQHEIREFCLQRQIRYFPINTSEPWDQFIIYEMRKAGVAA
ncbi:MAG: DUF58 domain-containing protein [Anaerolineae bacterium]|nr:DUF58 domain-containing protein [Anaerolineae bacterium]